MNIQIVPIQQYTQNKSNSEFSDKAKPTSQVSNISFYSHNKIKKANFAYFSMPKDKQILANKNLIHLSNINELKKMNFIQKFGNVELQKFHRKITLDMDKLGIFFITLSGCKPASLIYDMNEPLTFLNKCTPHLDVVQVDKNDKMKAYHAYILNKKGVKNVINKNKSIFTSRLNLPESTNIDDIYQKVLNILKNPEKYTDLEGLILGFPKYDSMIFYLEKINNLGIKRKDIEAFKTAIKNSLHSSNSPYKNLPDSETKSLEQQINRIHQIKISKLGPYYSFINYTDAKKDMTRIINATIKFNNEFNSAHF